MIISNEVALGLPPTDAYPLLLDLDAVAPCIPGATLDPVTSHDVRTGRVTIRFGPMSFSYAGQVQITSTDETALRAVLRAEGVEESGEGTATAMITMSVEPNGPGSRVLVESDLQLSGAAAQLGRAMIEDFAEAMFEDFADCLALTIAEPSGGGAVPAASAHVGAAIPPAASPTRARPARPLRARVLVWRVIRNRLRRLLRRTHRI